MLSGKELEMYTAQQKNIKVICKNKEVLSGYCSEFSCAYDNGEEGASITLKNGVRNKNGERLYPLTEVFEKEIETIEYQD